MKPERRSSPRDTVFRVGEIRPDSLAAPINCLVRNCSDTGALIEVRATAGLLETFRLTVPQIALDQSCVVVRRTKHLLGVRFIV